MVLNLRLHSDIMVVEGSALVHLAAALTASMIPPSVSGPALALSVFSFLHLCKGDSHRTDSHLASSGPPLHFEHRWVWLVCYDPDAVFFHSFHW